MAGHMYGTLASSCTWQNQRRPGIWYLHRLAGFLSCVTEGMGAGAAGRITWRISCAGVCLRRGVGGGGTILWRTSLRIFRVESLTSIRVTVRMPWGCATVCTCSQYSNGYTCCATLVSVALEDSNAHAFSGERNCDLKGGRYERDCSDLYVHCSEHIGSWSCWEGAGALVVLEEGSPGVIGKRAH